jgi:DNA-binding LacI/PurR family transcriptional regulator
MATIKQVAQRANVSIATVSYVINGTGTVAPHTRQAVLDAIAALQYRPSYRGRALQAQRSMTLAVVLPDAPDRMAASSFGALLAGITEGAAAHGYYLLLAAPEAEQPDDVIGNLARSGRIDGVVLLDVQADDPRIGIARSEHVPYICAGRPADNSPFVALDGMAGTLEAMAHLIVRGHERIGLIQTTLEQTIAEEQDTGYREALAEAGIAFDEALIVAGGRSEAEGYTATEELLSVPEPPTAIIAGSSALAFGALHALHDAGRRVGHDVALISFEDSPAAAHTAPPLTAIRQPLRAWGRALATGLIDVLQGREPPQVIVQPQLIVRRSCGE